VTLDTRTKKLIDRGRKAMRRVIATGEDAHAVLEFEGVPVDFRYGRPGDPERDFKGGWGVSHIVAKRDAQHKSDPLLHPETGKETAAHLVQTLVLGKTKRTDLVGDGVEVTVEWENYRVILLRKNGSYILSGYRLVQRKNPGATAAFDEDDGATHRTATLSSPHDGCGVSGTRTNPVEGSGPDLTYRKVDGLFTAFYPETAAGQSAWNQMAEHTEGTGKVLTVHAQSVIAQLRKAGYAVARRTGGAADINVELLAAELGDLDEELEEDRSAFRRVADLYAQALAADVLDRSFVPALNDALAELAAELGVEWTPPLVETEAEPIYHEPHVPDAGYELRPGITEEQWAMWRAVTVRAAWPPASRVQKTRRGWTLTDVDPKVDHPGTFRTKREAVEAAVLNAKQVVERVRTTVMTRKPFSVLLNGMQDVAIVEKMPLNVRGVEMWRQTNHYESDLRVLFDPAGKESEPAYYALMRIEDLVASHHPDCSRNTAHRIAAAQPRDRSAKELCGQAEVIAKSLNPVAITGGVLAFDGAPVVTQEGYVVQGNGRGISLRVMYEKYPERAKAYKEYLRRHASEWGLSNDDVARLAHPVLVRVITVTDGRAKTLGNIVNRSEAKISRLDEAKSFVRRLSDAQRRQIGMTLAAAKADTLREMMDEVGLGLLDHLNGLDRTGMLRGGELTVEAKDLLRDVFVGLVFDTDDNSGIRAYQAFPYATRSGIDKSLGYILPFIGTPYDLAPHLRGAALILHEMQAASGRFPNIAAYLDSADAFTGPARNRFSDEAAILAHVLSTTTTQGEIVRRFQHYERLASGYTSLFETVPPAKPFAAFAGAFNPGFRPNPEDCGCDANSVLAYFGKVVNVSVDVGRGKTKTFRDRMAFMTADGRSLIIVPRRRVKRVRAVPRDPAARAQFERFHHYNASGKGFFIDVPDTPSIAIGTARDIRYLSDKVMRSDDRKGKLNGYHHDFDTGQRPVTLHGDVLVIDRLEIDGRGILN